jgi:hypothetical protein
MPAYLWREAPPWREKVLAEHGERQCIRELTNSGRNCRQGICLHKLASGSVIAIFKGRALHLSCTQYSYGHEPTLE